MRERVTVVVCLSVCVCVCVCVHPDFGDCVVITLKTSTNAKQTILYSV